MAKRIAVYAGSFDPFTSGHHNIIDRAGSAFDHLHIAMGVNSSKKTLFTIEERIDMIHHECGHLIRTRDITVTHFEGLLVDYCKKVNASVILRGLRAVMDFEYEMGIAFANKTQAPDVETVFLPTDPVYSFVSSSVVKEIASHGGNVRAFCSPYVEQRLWAKFDRSKKSDG